MTEKIKLGISSCLLGNLVRYDGGHKQDRYLRDTLGAFVDYAPVCPEFESGMPVPREAMRLVGDPESPRLLTIRTQEDKTDMMLTWARDRLEQLAEEDLSGFIFKSRSPSSGMARVKVYSDKGHPAHTGVGIFARAFMDRFPDIPVEEDGRLHDPVLRESFITRVFAYGRWRELVKSGAGRGGLVDFHTRHKLLLMGQHVPTYRELGRLVAQAKGLDREELYQEYFKGFSYALGLNPTVKKNVNVLYHVMGYFKKQLSSDEKQELREIIDHYAKKLVPLIVPITLLNHFVRKYDQPYLKGQVYLNPHPVELQLRNHV